MADHHTNDPLNRLQTAAEAIATRSEWETGNRRGLLWVHALMGLLAGTQMLLFGSTPNIEHAVGLWTRPVLGCLGILGGGLLASGLLARPRSITREVYGLILMGLWDFSIMAGMIGARIAGKNFAPRPLFQQAPPGYVVPYAIAIYGGLFALICIHLYTLRRLQRSR